MQIKTGDVVNGIITGIQPYGAFVTVEGGHKGLIHISEISGRYVNDVHNFVRLNEVVKVKVLEINQQEEHLRLSLKAVTPNKKRFHTMKRYPVPLLPNSQIGFSSLKEKLDEWIEQAYQTYKEEKYDNI